MFLAQMKKNKSFFPILFQYKYNKKEVDTESVTTDISLLSMSTIRPETDNKKQKRKRRRRNKELVELLNPSRLSNETPRPADKQGPKWETFAKERKGLLDRLIAKDKGNLEGFVKGIIFWVFFTILKTNMNAEKKYIFEYLGSTWTPRSLLYAFNIFHTVSLQIIFLICYTSIPKYMCFHFVCF